MDSQALRRAAALSLHFVSSPYRLNLPSTSLPGIGMAPSVGYENRKDDKYRRVHGEVSTHPTSWRACLDDGPPFTDIIYEKAIGEGIAKITINRPEKRNAFRPQTVKEMMRALTDAHDDISIGVIILTGKGNEAFCSGGDQSVRGTHGYTDHDSFDRLNILDAQKQIRRLPKPVIAMVAGYCVGGGHVLHMVCDLTVAADNAIFGQTGPKVGSFDAGYGCSIMSQLIGTKRAREMWFLAQFYSAKQAMEMGLINVVVPLEKLEEETLKWCREILRNSPTAIRVCKAALNAVDEGHGSLQELAGNCTRLFYGTEEALEGKNAFMQARRPDFSKFPRHP